LHRVPIKTRERSIEVYTSELIEWAPVFFVLEVTRTSATTVH